MAFEVAPRCSVRGQWRVTGQTIQTIVQAGSTAHASPFVHELLYPVSMNTGQQRAEIYRWKRHLCEGGVPVPFVRSAACP